MKLLIVFLLVACATAGDVLSSPKVLNLSEFMHHFDNVYLRNAHGDVIPLLTLQNYSLTGLQVVGDNPQVQLFNAFMEVLIFSLVTAILVMLVICRNLLVDECLGKNGIKGSPIPTNWTTR